MFRLLLFFISFLHAIQSVGQATANPLEGKRWTLLGAGVNNGDGLSWHGILSHSKRGEYLIQGFRLGFSQELITAANDSCTASRSKNLEIGALWGEGWGGDKWYMAGSAGFGLNHRWYCLYDEYDDFVQKRRLLIGVPAQLEAGINLSTEVRIGLVITANWNFLQPYVGGMLGISYWPGKKRE